MINLLAAGGEEEVELLLGENQQRFQMKTVVKWATSGKFSRHKKESATVPNKKQLLILAQEYFMLPKNQQRFVL